MMIKTNAEIIINRGIKETFDFLANVRNDYLWRREINETIVDGPIQLGAKAAEYSKLSPRKPNHKTVLTCTGYNENEKVVFEALDTEFYLRSTRVVQNITINKTKVIYTIEFDASIVKYAFGFFLPAFIISIKANADAKKYLSKLKSVLET